MSAEVSREKYSCSSCGSAALADGRSDADPVDGTGGRRDADQVSTVMPLHPCSGALTAGTGVGGGVLRDSRLNTLDGEPVRLPLDAL